VLTVAGLDARRLGSGFGVSRLPGCSLYCG
jgi:hypothetical protein